MNQRRAIPTIAGTVVCGLIVSVLAVGAATAQKPFTEWTDAEKETFLLNAEVVERTENDVGITSSDIVTLDDGRVQHRAQIQTINDRSSIRRFEDGTTLIGFIDCYCYNIVGYRLDRLIGLNMVPVAVPRRDGQKEAAYVWWREDIQMMERDRYLENIQPPRPLEWSHLVGDMNVFHQLIYDNDPNMTNVLITDNWQIKLVDFGRAFRGERDLRSPEDLHSRISRHLYDGLNSLTREKLETIRGDLENVVGGSLMDALLARRDLIVEHFDSLIASRGEELVLGD
jgi:hypothetical protein